MLIRNRGLILATNPVLVAADVTWSTTDHEASITLSNSNKTATATAAGDRGGRATSGKTSGKWYYEFTTGAVWTGGDTCGGLLKGSPASLTNLGSSGALGLAVFTNGHVWNGSDQGSTLGSIGANTTIGCAVDLDAGKGWFTLNGLTWSFSGNPVAGTNGTAGGWTIGDTVFPAFCFGGNGNGITGAFTPAFAFAVPSGFSSWQ